MNKRSKYIAAAAQLGPIDPNDSKETVVARMCNLLTEAKAQYLFVAGCNDIIGIGTRFGQSNIASFENKGFVEWCKHKNFDIGKFKHPLQQAHRSAADYLVSNVNMFDAHSSVAS